MSQFITCMWVVTPPGESFFYVHVGGGIPPGESFHYVHVDGDSARELFHYGHAGGDSAW